MFSFQNSVLLSMLSSPNASSRILIKLNDILSYFCILVVILIPPSFLHFIYSVFLEIVLLQNLFYGMLIVLWRYISSFR